MSFCLSRLWKDPHISRVAFTAIEVSILSKHRVMRYASCVESLRMYMDPRISVHLPCPHLPVGLIGLSKGETLPWRFWDIWE